MNNKISTITCQICGDTFTVAKPGSVLANHVYKCHNLSSEEYYISYINPNVSLKCPICNKPKKYRGILLGYSATCTDPKCIKEQLSQQAKSDEYQAKKRATNLERYGVEHHLQNKQIMQKQINTDLDRYGVSRPLQDKQFLKLANERRKNTVRSEEYKNKKVEIRDKYKATLIKKYGVDNTFAIPSVKERRLIAMAEKTKINNIDLQISKKLGEGSECVYMYYYDVYKDRAQKDGKNEYECRICSVNTDDPTTVVKSYSLASPELPIIGLAIKCDNAVGLKTTLQFMLQSRGKKLNTLSDDWFYTTVEEVEELYKLVTGQ